MPYKIANLPKNPEFNPGNNCLISHFRSMKLKHCLILHDNRSRRLVKEFEKFGIDEKIVTFAYLLYAIIYCHHFNVVGRLYSKKRF